MVKKFRQFLFENFHLDMEKQKILLQEELIIWKGSKAQTDDVLVIGIKFQLKKAVGKQIFPTAFLLISKAFINANLYLSNIFPHQEQPYSLFLQL